MSDSCPHNLRGMSHALSFSDGAVGMSLNTDAEDLKLQNANGGEQISPAVENNSMVNTTGLTDEERALYEQVQAEINAMILLEEEKERTKAEWQKTMIYGYHSDRRAYQLQGLPFDFSSPRDNIEERSIRVSLEPLRPKGLQT